MHKFKVGDRVKLTKVTLQKWLATNQYTDIIKTEALIEQRLGDLGFKATFYILLFPSSIYKTIDVTRKTGYVLENDCELANVPVTLWDI